MAPSRRLAAVALPPSARVPPADVGPADDRQLRVAVDDDPVVPDPLVGLRPVRGAGRVDAGDVLDDEPRRAADEPMHLEAERALGARLEPAHHGVDRLLERPALDVLA